MAILHPTSRDGGIKYHITFDVVARLSDRHEVESSPWSALVMFELNAIDLAAFMQRAPGHGDYYDDASPVLTWRLREFPDSPAAESRWTGRIILSATPGQTLSEFGQGEVMRGNITMARVESAFGRTVFCFDPEGSVVMIVGLRCYESLEG
ncbi:hypothetical protein B0T26DRAFT_800800 [Lasiosphaeria miniovina]|uniref:Uncharacterized protein n=1 Tax=Lasiosphaeria miniovina TaxID=1954250 RepID=A0AA40ATX6_9PEZI|nr:uncharacterized protein B0T26DRAFT_800800 [Lasiosphaeria miniovina]KAK0721929.1 hypothetical protein B0T26DRAFT_800800 [Lasiosphaeria miniovina]